MRFHKKEEKPCFLCVKCDNKSVVIFYYCNTPPTDDLGSEEETLFEAVKKRVKEKFSQVIISLA